MSDKLTDAEADALIRHVFDPGYDYIEEVTDFSPESLAEECYRADMSSFELDSSNIAHAGYEPGRATMILHFTGGGRYRYSNVLFHEFWALVNAESAGKYFATHIRNNRDISCIKEVS